MSVRAREHGWLVFALITLFAGCNDAAVVGSKKGSDRGSAGQAEGSNGSGANPSPDRGSGNSGGGGAAEPPPLAPPPDPGNAPPPAPPEPEQCAEEAHAAERLPVDMLVLLDRSGSMNQRASGTQTSKWELIRQALLTFVNDPASSGFGVGLETFPALQANLLCEQNDQCTSATCLPERVCTGATPPDGGIPEEEQGPQACMRDADCKYGATCVARGRCSKTGRVCTDIDQDCDHGVGDDVCTQLPRTCLDDSVSCDVADYADVQVAIAELPGAATALGERLMLIDPRSRGAQGAGTPLGPAVEGGLAHLREHLAATPNRRAVLVLATDAEPSRCQPRNIGAISTLLEGAAQGTPRIATFVIGVLGAGDGAQNRNALGRLAVAGSTNQPFIATTNQNLMTEFLAALEQIRGAILPCTFAIPAARANAIDFGKVNLRFKTGMSEEDILYVGSADRCDPAQGGWYYDVDPATARPTSVIVCPATCERFKGNEMAAVDLTFGCRTRTVE